MLIGAHISIAGGVDKALGRGKELGCEAIQIFVKNNNQWFNKPLTVETIANFLRLQKETGIFVFAHAGYLINLCAPNPDNYDKSIRSMLEELEKCEQLQLPYIVLHPGSHGGQGEEAGIKKVALSLDQLCKATKDYKVKILLETTAGQGTGLGNKFEHFARWFDQVNEVERLGICFDTCHAFAAGYDLRSKDNFEKIWQEFDQLVGLEKVMAIHLNDCKGELGSHLDRHEHIGKGIIGKEAFKLLVNDQRFKDLPGVLETPKDPEMKLDRMNLKLLRSLVI